MNNDPIKPNVNIEPVVDNNEKLDNANNEVNTNVVNNNANNEVNKSVHPTSASIKDLHGIDTSAFKKNNGPRIDTPAENTSLHASAFNAVHEKKVETLVEEKPEKSKAGLVVFLVLLVLFVLFLPNIQDLTQKFLHTTKVENITDGELRCTLKKTTSNFDISYEQQVPFANNRVKGLKYIETTKGDLVEDKEALDEKNATCEKLGQIAGNVAGLSVDCEFTGESIIETQTLDYDSLNREELTSAYAEAGGTAPEFEKDQDINEVQKKLQSAGYTCTKIK